ncbi:MAG: twin-arginine translocation signal domain-containing protein, partial [Candidatus Cryptobacteroides sp.]
MDRRDFLKKAAAGSAAVAVGGTAIGGATLLGGCSGSNCNKASGNAKDSRMRLTFEPYELQLRHVFTVSSY